MIAKAKSLKQTLIFSLIYFQFSQQPNTKTINFIHHNIHTLVEGIGLPGLLAIIASTMVRTLALPFPLHTKSKQGSFTQYLSSHGGIWKESSGSGSETLLKTVAEEKRASMAFWIAKMRKMKKKDANSWRKVALLFRHESKKFFLNSALYC